MSILVSVAILTYNRRAEVLEAIRSAFDQDLPADQYEVVVADNNSSDDTVHAIAEKYPQVRLIRLPRNVGCPEGRNFLYANCRGKYIVNVDDDGSLARNSLVSIVDIFEKKVKSRFVCSS